MKERKVVLLFTIFFIGSGFICQSKSQANGRWSGTISERSQVTGAPGLHSESLVTIRFTNNEGTGTYISTGVLNADGKILTRTSCTGTGSAGFSELSIDNVSKTYTIQTSAFIYTCMYTGQFSASSDSGEAIITIAEEPWDENPRVLAGSKMIVTDMPGGGRLTTTTNWNLAKESDVELIVTPRDYDWWLPIPGTDEQTPGPEMM